MSNVRIIAWNIKDFKLSRFTQHSEAILDRLYDSSRKSSKRQTDIFIIIEPFSRMKKFGVGAVVTDGAGIAGMQALYYALADIDPKWRLVPPRAACMPPKSDMIAVYYHSDVVTFEGPDDVPYVEPNAPAGNTHSLHWGSGQTMKSGQVRFLGPQGTEINFYGRRPFLLKFKTNPGQKPFLLLALHAPPDSRYPANANMVKHLAQILEITVNAPNIPVAICGDFNVCPIPSGCRKDHKQDERDALKPLTTAQPPYKLHNLDAQNVALRTGLNTHNVGARRLYAEAKLGNGALNDITTHAYDHVLTRGFAAGTTAKTINILELDGDYADALLQAQQNNHHPVYALCRRYLWSKGVSDHLPVMFTVSP